MSSAQTTTDHDVIRRWTAGRAEPPPSGAREAGSAGNLRPNFGHKEESLERAGCNDFFRNGQD